MYRTLEVIFRQPIRLLLLVVLLPVVSLAVAYFLPRTYQATATLWALRRYEAISATGLESNPYATPAETQATALSELLQTRFFALAVAKSTDLPSTLDANVRANPALLDDALFNEISQHVTVQSQGYNLLFISYTNRSPSLAQRVVKAIVLNYGLQSVGLTQEEGQRLLDTYKQQLVKAQHDADVAAAAESQYLLQHPELSKDVLTNPGYAASADPHYAQLLSQTKQLQTEVQNIQASISTIEQEVSLQGQDADNLFKIIDSPLVPSQPVSRMKQLLTAAGIGLGVALVTCALYIVILVRRDQAVYTPLDLQEVAPVPVLMQLPHLPAKTKPLLIAQFLPGSS